MRCKYKSADYRKHFNQWRRAMTAPQHDYDGKGAIINDRAFNPRARMALADLVRYASALGRKRGQLPESLTEFYALGIRRDDGTGYVDFMPGRYVKARYGFELRADRDAVPIRVELRNLDWQPDEPVEERIQEAA
jgi:hypothetical protein